MVAAWRVPGEPAGEAVYEAVQNKGMDWFDTGMGMREDTGDKESESVGAGGLMAKFTRYACHGGQEADEQRDR